MSCEVGRDLENSLLEVGSICRGKRGGRRGRGKRERRKKGGREGRGEREVEELEEGGEGGEGEQRKKGREMKPFCCKLLTTSAAYFILPPIGSV